MIFALGSNGSGQLGLDDQDDRSLPKSVNAPFILPSLSKTVRIISGGNHTILLQDGKLFGSGHLPNGQDRTLFSTQSFNLIPTPDSKHIKLCAATWESLTIVTADDEVYSVGIGSKGQLGLGPDATNSPEFIKMAAFPPEGSTIDDISGSMSHIVAVLSTGEVYGWGAGRQGQLGSSPQNIWSPRKIAEVLFSAQVVRCGRDFTVIAGHEPGNLLVIGNDRSGIVSQTPTTIPPWIEIAAGWSSAYILTKDGTILSWGKNHHRQLAPDNLPSIQKISVGSEHVLALSTEGEVITWGWGEHGNCGVSLDDSGNVGGWNVLTVPGNVEAIGAGCATSWIITGK